MVPPEPNLTGRSRLCLAKPVSSIIKLRSPMNEMSFRQYSDTCRVRFALQNPSKMLPITLFIHLSRQSSPNSLKSVSAKLTLPKCDLRMESSADRNNKPGLFRNENFHSKFKLSLTNQDLDGVKINKSVEFQKWFR